MRRQNAIQNQTNVKQRQTKQHKTDDKTWLFWCKISPQKHCITFESDHEATQYDNAAPIEREAAIDTTGNTLITVSNTKNNSSFNMNIFMHPKHHHKRQHQIALKSDESGNADSLRHRQIDLAPPIHPQNRIQTRFYQPRNASKTQSIFSTFWMSEDGVRCVYQFVIFGGWRRFLILPIFA
eukprot:663319_1